MEDSSEHPFLKQVAVSYLNHKTRCIAANPPMDS